MRVITGTARGRRLGELEGMDTRPTYDRVKEGMFNTIQFDIEGRRVLDLFAGTGAMSFEFLSRGCAHVTAVEKARVQADFIKRVQQQLGDSNLTLVRGDVFKFVATCRQSFDVIFADPPYDLPRFGDIPKLVLDSPLVHDGTLFIMEHPREHDFSALPHFSQQRVYGKVNFTLFEINNTHDNNE
jgi:16S rRNA (guanine(966)-N(2))-methyltransferase RsmD